MGKMQQAYIGHMQYVHTKDCWIYLIFQTGNRPANLRRRRVRGGSAAFPHWKGRCQSSTDVPIRWLHRCKGDPDRASPNGLEDRCGISTSVAGRHLSSKMGAPFTKIEDLSIYT